ncbi:MAG: TetR/AcrR family transcriptional regulator [Proteobacteria bacterium]|nr:TetR/AcrR family transcriptional regulator [Pseudomonadota bacterium]MBU1582982.1 TetR/AcrR family transcriptional regulator [Pseudomonadota bacterium]MBU2456117.1 TetR/AcrR family transcriptional regulator [Pseudomonadota bacterium]MBU2631775.1 TetR/AcrR family transcriptional regulator [Pseudomonadota bacterium]
MDYALFKEMMTISKEELYLETLAENRESIQIKKEETIIKNLEKIFKATLKISNQKGFQAMTMRELSQEAGISLGALYAYFKSKDDLLGMLQNQRRAFVSRMLEKEIEKQTQPILRLRAMIRTHLFLSEIMQPWFYFSFMEAKNLGPKEKKKAIESDLWSGNLLEKLLIQGQAEKVFKNRDTSLTAEAIKAMLQDWYLKRSKFRTISVDRYFEFIMEVVETYLGVAATI